MIGNTLTDKKGNPLGNVSTFQPSQEVKVLTGKIKEDFAQGQDNLNKAWEEFNNESVISRMNIDQRAFNIYVEPKSEDPDQRWRFSSTRPITRNKIIGIAAQVTASVLVPNTFAQNGDDEEDKDAANVMRDLMKWNIKNSDYEETFLFAVISALVNPCVYLRAEYAEVMQNIKVRMEDGSISREEVLDEMLSGFQTNIVPVDEMLIANIYEYEIQKQRFIGRKRSIEFEEAKKLYGKHENWEFIRPGIRSVFNQDDATFYDQKDQSLNTLVEEFTYYNRSEDLEVVFVNGVYVGDTDPDANPIKHRDNKNMPKYPYAKSGYEPIDEKRFFYYKSAAFKLANDQDLVDSMWEMVMDGTFLSVMPPITVSGSGDKLDSSVMFPGSVTNFKSDTKVDSLAPRTDLAAGYAAIEAAEKSLSETSQSPQRSGQPTPGVGTAFESAQIERNARIQLGLFGKMVGHLVVDFGLLMIDDILQHQTVAQIDEITGGLTKLNYRSFVLQDDESRGKSLTKKINFNEALIGREMTESEVESAELALLKSSGGLESDTALIDVNPVYFSGLKFKLSVEPDSLIPKNDAFEKAMKLEAYDRLIQNPLVDIEKVTRDFLVEPFAKGESDKYIKKGAPELAAQIPQAPASKAPAQAIRGEAGGGDLSALLTQV